MCSVEEEQNVLSLCCSTGIFVKGIVRAKGSGVDSAGHKSATNIAKEG